MDQEPSQQGRRERRSKDGRSRTAVSPAVSTARCSDMPGNVAGCTSLLYNPAWPEIQLKHNTTRHRHSQRYVSGVSIKTTNITHFFYNTI